MNLFIGEPSLWTSDRWDCIGIPYVLPTYPEVSLSRRHWQCSGYEMSSLSKGFR